MKFSNLLQKLKFLVGSRLKLCKPANSVVPVMVWWIKCDNEASQVEFELGLGVKNKEIHTVYAHSFILSTKRLLRTVCSQRYYVKKLRFLIILIFGDTLYILLDEYLI